MKKDFFNKLNKPYVIAEIGVNHECSIVRAKKLIKLAKKGGADAVKFQTYKANTLASKYSPVYWDTKKERTNSQFKLFKKYDRFNYEDYELLFKFCKKIKIDFLSTPFDIDAVKNLKKLVSFFKIASADINNLPLLRSVGKTRKPVLISTGASTITEIKEAVSILKKNGTKSISIMHCILNYPTKNINANLGMIKSLKKIFKKQVIGYSDHTVPDNHMSSLIFAYTLGAEIFEKHFTDNKRLKGNDHYHSMDYKDLKIFIQLISDFKKKLGKLKKEPIKSELNSIKFARRSIYAKTKILKGVKIQSNHLICKRPGIGISPKLWNKLLGRVTRKIIPEDRAIKWSHLK